MGRMIHNLSERIRKDEPVPAPVHVALWLASFGQRFGMWLRLRGAAKAVPAHVVSFGNITVGGVGKTPAVIARAARECDAGKRVAVLTRGYGASPARTPLILAPGMADATTAARFGDEAALIARRVPTAWIVRAADRVAGAQAAFEAGCTLLIMDDGFQAVALARNENILLVDAANPFGNGYLVPRGILREPLQAMRRATEIILTRCDQAGAALDALEKTIRYHAPHTPIRYTQHKPVGLWRLCDNGDAPLSLLRETPVRVVCAIGNPDAFLTTLRDLGAHIVETHCLPDHGAIPQDMLASDVPVIMTEKDAMRLPETPRPDIYALAISLETYTR